MRSTSSCTSFGMSTSPVTKKRKKHISNMLCAQVKSTKNNASKDELSLLQVKLMVAKENVTCHNAGTRERHKAEILVNKLQQKLNQALDSSSASDEESNCFSESGS
jgi:hypothetical protein